MGEIVTCTLRLENDGDVMYHDTITDRSIKGRVDPDRLRRDTRDWLVAWVARKDGPCERREVELLGRHLYETLFHDKAIREEFERRIHFVLNRGDARMRMQLVFHEDAKELARLPWEFLYLDLVGRRPCFLAGELEQFVLTRFVPPLPDPANLPAPLERPVRLLLAACTDEGFGAEEIRDLVKLLDKRSESPVDDDGPAADVEVRKLRNPTYDELKDAVQGVTRDPDGTLVRVPAEERWLPDVVHVIGHGEPGAIMLRRRAQAVADDEVLAADARLRGRTAPPVAREQRVEAMTLRGLFDPHHPPFVFLQTCYGDAIDGAALYTTAQRIVQAGVPAVIAMQYDIEREPADKFACRVYEELLNGKRVAAAVSAGRILLREGAGATSPYRAFGTPVVYLGHDGPLVKERPKARARSSKANPGPERQEYEVRRCPRCGMTCRYQACWNCELRFRCDCEMLFENPLGSICGACTRRIDQPPWTPTRGDGLPVVEEAREPSGPALDSPIPPRDERPQKDSAP